MTTGSDRTWSPFTIGWFIVVAGAVIFRVLTTSSWSFFQDDWVYLGAAGETPFLDFVIQDYNSHLMPAGFALVWVATALSPLDYTWVMASTSVMTVGLLVAWGLALRELFGERLRLLFVLVLLGLGSVEMTLGLWWAASLQYLPLQIASGVCVWLLARCLLRGPRVIEIAGIAIALLIGLLFWQKAILIAIPLAFLPLMVAPGHLAARMRLGFRCLWPAGLVSLGYLAVYVLVPRRASFDTFPNEFPRGRTLTEIAGFYSDAVTGVALPAVVGGPFTEVSDAYGRLQSPPTWLALVLAVSALAAVVMALRLRSRSAPALGLVATYALVSWGTVLFSSRYDDFGVAAVYEGRYLCDVLPVLLLAVVFLVTPLRTEPDQQSTQLRRVVGGYAVVVSCVALVVSAHTWNLTRDSSPKPWVDALVSDARELEGVGVYDSVAPANVIDPVFMFGRANVSDLLSPLDLDLEFNAPTQDGLLIAGSDGRFYQGEVASPVSTSISPGPQPDCGYLLEPGRTVRVPLTASVYEFEWI
uniref:hypothetical protein n=1 Tax=Nocardioides sp. TaxID=35761 RepID=UPI0035627132